MLTFQESQRPANTYEYLSLYVKLECLSGGSSEPLNGYLDERSVQNSRLSPRNQAFSNQGGAIRKMKRESRALVLISPETNAPIEHYRSSDQSSSSEEALMMMTGAKTQLLPSSSSTINPIPELPSHSKLHRWMEGPSSTKTESMNSQLIERTTGGGGGLGLYFYGMSANIWSQNQVPPSEVVLSNQTVRKLPDLDYELNLSCALNNGVADFDGGGQERAISDIEVCPDPQGGIPKTSRLWTWMGDAQ